MCASWRPWLQLSGWLWLTAIQRWLLHHRKPLMKSCMSVTLVIGPFIFPKVSRTERNTRRWTYGTSTPAVCKLGFLNIKRSSSICKSQTSSVISMSSQSPEVTGQRYRIPAISKNCSMVLSSPVLPFQCCRCHVYIHPKWLLFEGWERSLGSQLR